MVPLIRDFILCYVSHGSLGGVSYEGGITSQLRIPIDLIMVQYDVYIVFMCVCVQCNVM